MSVRELAERDIRESLKQNGKSFIAFRTELNGVMNEITTEYLEAQQKSDEERHSWCLSGWALKF